MIASPNIRRLCMLLFLICSITVVAQQPYYDLGNDGSTLSFTKEDPLKEEQKKLTPPGPYKLGIRVGGGFTYSIMRMAFPGTFDNDGYVDGEPVEVLYPEHDTGFDYKNIVGNIQFKTSLAEPLQNFSVGLDLEFSVVTLKGVSFTAWDTTRHAEQIVSVIPHDINFGEVADIYTFSFMFFLEYKHPIQLGNSWLAPYCQVGVGAAFNSSEDDDILKIAFATIAFYVSVGAEYYLSENYSLFFEVKYNYKDLGTEFDLNPADPNNTFNGDMGLGNFAFMIGINFYLGTKNSF